MTTTLRPGGLRGWSTWCVSVALSLAFCASAFAGSDGNGVQAQKAQEAKKVVRVCYVISDVSAIPQPCDRFAGPIPTTTQPIEIIGRGPSPR
jgi:hypothetical protein